MIHTLTNEGLAPYIESGQPVVVDFFASWCQPCQRMLKILPRLTEEFEGKVTFVKIDVDEYPDIADQYNVKVIPTFIIFNGGKEVAKWEGVKTLLEMKRVIEANV